MYTYYLAIKKNKIIYFATTWMELGVSCLVKNARKRGRDAE